MVGKVGLHRADHTEVIRHRCGVRKELTYLQPALAIFLEREWRWKGGSGLAFSAEVDRDWFSCPFFQQGLGIEAIELRGAAIHEEVDDPFGFWRKVGLAKSERRLRLRPSTKLRGALDRSQAAQDASQAEPGHAHARAPQRLSAREQSLHANQQTLTHWIAIIPAQAVPRAAASADWGRETLSRKTSSSRVCSCPCLPVLWWAPR